MYIRVLRFFQYIVILCSLSLKAQINIGNVDVTTYTMAYEGDLYEDNLGNIYMGLQSGGLKLIGNVAALNSSNGSVEIEQVSSGTFNLKARNPWHIVGSNEVAVSNTENIYSLGRVAIGGDNTPISAALSLNSTTKGLLLPRLTSAQRDNIPNPAIGLTLFNISSNSIDYYNGSSWKSVKNEDKGEVICGTISVIGDYYLQQDLTATEHRVEIELNVNETGDYFIYSDKQNGFSFFDSGVFVSTGTQVISLIGSGNPQTPIPTSFELKYDSLTCPFTVSVQSVYSSCKDALLKGETTDGVYSIDPDGVGGKPKRDCYCDMTTDGGGWTLVASSLGAIKDQAIGYFSELTTLDPTSLNDGIWDGMRNVIADNSDIRFSGKRQSSSNLECDIVFYNNIWYTVLTAFSNHELVCFYTSNGSRNNYGRPARKDLLNNVFLAEGSAWLNNTNVPGEMEGEDNCEDNNDFTVDLQDRGIKGNKTDGTDWGRDGNTEKCGVRKNKVFQFYVWVREI